MTRTKRSDTHCRNGHEFTPENTYWVQRRRRCRLCCAERIREWRIRHHDDPAYKEKRNKSAVRSYARHSDKIRARIRQSVTGFTQEEYDRKFVEQDGLCAVCRTAAASAADHDHTTGEHRGLLCHRCNLLLGFIEKTPEIVKDAVVYLARWRR